MEDDNQPATKGDLRALSRSLDATKEDVRALSRLLDEKFATKGDLGKMASELRDDMSSMERRMVRDLSDALMRAIAVANEDFKRQVSVLDDKYKDLPGRVATVERELDEHRRDGTVHKRSRKN